MPATFPNTSPLLKFLIFSYFSGCELLHKCANINKRIRQQLPQSGLLNQIKIVTIKFEMTEQKILPNAESFLYAMSLVDGIQIQVDKNNYNYANLIHNYCKMATIGLKKQEIFIDIIFIMTTHN